jgi:hypothetical protein
MRRALAVAAALLLAAGLHAQRPGVTPHPQEAAPAAAADTVGRPVVQDTLIDRLLRLEGYDPVEYTGDSAHFDNRERTLRLRGNPAVERGGQRITARDSIVYRERRDFVEVYGDPRATGEGQDITGDVMYYDLAARRAIVRGARTTLTEGATWFVHGDLVSEEQGERIYAAGSTFTSDDREDPAYYFRADRIKVIRNRVLVGRPAYLYFRGVPVFVLPFIVQDLERGRRSGVLIPEFEINDIIRTDATRPGDRGTGRQISNVGYYWAINEFMGARAALDWRSQSWTALQVGYQFSWRRRFLGGNASLDRFWVEGGARRFNLVGSGSWQPDERTQLSTAINYASSTQFERDRIVDPFRQTSDISSTLSASRRMDWGQLSSGAELRQSIATGDNNLSARLSVSPQTVTLFPSGVRPPAWYHDGSLTLSADGSTNRTSPGEALLRRQQPRETNAASLGGSIRFGPVGISGSTRYGAEWTRGLAPIDSTLAAPGSPGGRFGALPEVGVQTLEWSASTGYEFRLIGATRLTPSFSFGQQMVRRDTSFEGTPPDSLDLRRWGSFVGAPLRLSVGSSLRTELFGFFPGFGSYSALRHRISPSLNHRYVPAARQDTVQQLVFGPLGGREVNEVTFGFDQTWEAKRRPRPESELERGIREAGEGNPADAGVGVPGAQTDAAGAALAFDDPAGAHTSPDTDGPAASTDPVRDEKITLLAINTSSLLYSFVPVDTFGTRFQTGDIQNTVRSDLLGGFTVTLSHDLFEGDEAQGLFGGAGTGTRRFSPFLTGLQTSLSFGAGSALFRWLGFARAEERERRGERGRTPPDQGVPTAEPPGAQTFTNRPMVSGRAGPGGGAWNASVNYSLRRTRPLRGDVPAAVDRGNQQLSGNVSFFPARNWGVSWYTDYSITENAFGAHSLNLKRDLYRWQANFDFRRAPNGNTSFSFSVHLTDLPDLKADYRRSNLGGGRPR